MFPSKNPPFLRVLNVEGNFVEYIDLNRYFASPKKDDDEYSYLEYLGASKTLWEDLLQYECVVVLGGAGSGKTEEFQRRTEIHKASGKFAVFFAIEELAGNSIEDCLSLEDEQNLENWHSSGDIGYFFLDSVDEAKLKSKNDFIRALRKLSKKLGDHVNRSRIFISCRPSDWDHNTDIKIIKKKFSFLKLHSAKPLKPILSLKRTEGNCCWNQFYRTMTKKHQMILKS